MFGSGGPVIPGWASEAVRSQGKSREWPLTGHPWKPHTRCMPPNPHWRQRSKCRKLTVEQHDKLFFPSSRGTIKQARRFCESCEVFQECLDFAIETDAHGIWAGMNKKERDSLVEFRDRVAGIPKPEVKKSTAVTHKSRRKRKQRTNFQPL